MLDADGLTEARLKGTEVVTVACEYQSTSNKADKVIVLRPGSDPAFALGISNIIIQEKLYDAEFIRGHTDLPFLVRMDTLKFLKPQDIIKGYQPKELQNTQVLKEGEKIPSSLKQLHQVITENLRNEWGDFVAWNLDKNGPEVVTRDDSGSARNFALEEEFSLEMIDGKSVKVRPVFNLLKEHVSYFTPQTVSDICHVDKEAMVWLAQEIAKNKSQTLVPVGMGPNHFFNNDLKDRAIFLVCALTKNIGFHSGNIGSYAGK